MNNSNYLIEYKCPQCGAPAVLEETDRLFSCGYCRVKSYLFGGKYFRYMFPNNAPPDREVFFFPYWRFKGMGFSCDVDGIKNKIIDISQQAITTPYFPFSVGLRSQALKLRFVNSETRGYFLNPVLHFEQVKECLEDRSQSSFANNAFFNTFIGETISLIYSPFYMDKRIKDAILNEPVSQTPPDDFDIKAFAGGKPDWDIHFLASLCPECGWDLTGQRASLMMNCSNCNSVWSPSRTGFRKIKFAHIPGGDKEIMYFPFWRIKADISGVKLDSYGDLVKIANLPKVVRGSGRENDFYFWALAFKLRPQFFLNFCRNLTLSQPRQRLEPELPKASVYPVTLSVGRAAESLKLNLLSLIRPRSRVPEVLPDIQISPKDVMLVYIPFHEGHHEFIQPMFQMSIHKNILSMSGNL